MELSVLPSPAPRHTPCGLGPLGLAGTQIVSDRQTRLRKVMTGRRMRHTESKNGCRNCVRRHLKCDEIWPQCDRCTKRGDLCEPAKKSAPNTRSTSNIDAFSSSQSCSIDHVPRGSRPPLSKPHRAQALRSGVASSPKLAPTQYIPRTPSGQTGQCYAIPASPVPTTPSDLGEFECELRANALETLSYPSRVPSHHKQLLEIFRDCDGTRLDRHKKDETCSRSPSLNCHQHTRDSRECHAEKQASRRPHASPHAPNWPAVRKSEIDELLDAPRYLEWSSARVRHSTPAATDTPSSNERFRYKPELDNCTASLEILLWPSIKRLLEEAGIDLEAHHATNAENLPKLHIYSTAGDNGDPGDRFLIFGDGYGTRCKTSHEYSAESCLELSTSKVNSCFASFMERIYIIHPFLDATNLRKSFDDFISRYNPRSQYPDTVGVGDESNPWWRLRPSNESFRVPRERLPDDAMIFLVLALGEICEHAGPLPTTNSDRKGNNDEMCDTPGLVYFERAVKIMSSTACADALIHAQIYLLAGLYMGELARVRESMSWFTLAGRVLRRLIDRHKLYNDYPWTVDGDLRQQFEESLNLVTGKMQHFVVLASWSCLQLEGEVLAQLRLPSSGMRTIEGRLPLPQIFPREDHESLSHERDEERDTYLERLLLVYTAQVFLWKRLNQSNNDLYGSDHHLHLLDKVCVLLRNHEATLDAWRECLPSAFKWCDWDPPSSNILVAWLRAKYWEARYVVDRHFLDYALHIMPYVQSGYSVRDVALDAHGNPREKSEVRILEAIAVMVDDEVWAGCRRCIDAATQSTVAFDGIPGRLIVPDIHGTAHAQFRNMLVLCATYLDNRLQCLIDRQYLFYLLSRTITFLKGLTPISTTCRYNCSILENIWLVIFGPHG